MRKTTAIYARYSSHAQDGGTSIEVQLDACRRDLPRVRAKIGELDKKIGSMTRLLVDPDIDATAKRAVSRQVGELEAERAAGAASAGRGRAGQRRPRPHRPAGRNGPPNPHES
jgi:hypothetical protein